MEIENWKLEIGSWKLEIGNWKLEIGSWKLEVGSWKQRETDPKHTENVHNGEGVVQIQRKSEQTVREW